VNERQTEQNRKPKRQVYLKHVVKSVKTDEQTDTKTDRQQEKSKYRKKGKIDCERKTHQLNSKPKGQVYF
jgi:hypothetical protein